jgi:hypothetical protein
MLTGDHPSEVSAMSATHVRRILGSPWIPMGAAILTAASAVLWSAYDDERWLQGAAVGLVLTAVPVVVGPRHEDASYFPWRQYDALLLAVASVLVVALVGTAVDRQSEKLLQLETANRLRLLSLALVQYESEHRHLPGPAICAADGTPLLSWRVALLPYLEHAALFARFHLDEPWDSEYNLALLPLMPEVFAPMPGAQADPFTTPFRVFVGPGTAFENDRVRSGGMRDGASNTLAVVEASETVPWTQPEELAFGPGAPRPPLGRVRTNRHRWLFPHPPAESFTVVMCDGSVRRVSAGVSDASLHAAITHSGPDALGPDWPP